MGINCTGPFAFFSFFLRKASLRNLTILLVAKERSSVPDVALSVGHNPRSVNGRIPVVIQCSLRFISNSLRRSRGGHLEIHHAGSGSPPCFTPPLTDACFVGRLLWNIHSSANVPDDLLPLAFGTKACSAGDVPKVPKAWELGGPPR